MSTIEWCDVTWNPVVGCSRVSSGCDNCYAIGVAARNLCTQHRGLTKIRPKDADRPGADWTGEVRTLPAKLVDPLKWRKPRRIFVNSMSDLFHDQVPWEFAAAVLGVAAVCPQHTFIIVTKRPERGIEVFREIEAYASRLAEGTSTDVCVARATLSVDGDDLRLWWGRLKDSSRKPLWPLPNVHILVSAEDQRTWDKRVPLLMKIPAAVRGVSVEPMLEHIADPKGIDDLDWVVVGGESGRGPRPCAVPWIRSFVDTARDARVACFVKQLGSWPVGAGVHGKKNSDPGEWPEPIRVRELPRGKLRWEAPR